MCVPCLLDYLAVRRRELLYAEHLAAVQKSTFAAKFITAEIVNGFSAYGEVRAHHRISACLFDVCIYVCMCVFSCKTSST